MCMRRLMYMGICIRYTRNRPSRAINASWRWLRLEFCWLTQNKNEICETQLLVHQMLGAYSIVNMYIRFVPINALYLPFWRRLIPWLYITNRLKDYSIHWKPLFVLLQVGYSLFGKSSTLRFVCMSYKPHKPPESQGGLYDPSANQRIVMQVTCQCCHQSCPNWAPSFSPIGPCINPITKMYELRKLCSYLRYIVMIYTYTSPLSCLHISYITLWYLTATFLFVCLYKSF